MNHFFRTAGKLLVILLALLISLLGNRLVGTFGALYRNSTQAVLHGGINDSPEGVRRQDDRTKHGPFEVQYLPGVSHSNTQSNISGTYLELEILF